MIKSTPPAHDDYNELRRALTVLENLAFQLNEKKRSSEEKLAAKVMLSKLGIKNSGTSTLIRQDDVTEQVLVHIIWLFTEYGSSRAIFVAWQSLRLARAPPHIRLYEYTLHLLFFACYMLRSVDCCGLKLYWEPFYKSHIFSQLQDSRGENTLQKGRRLLLFNDMLCLIKIDKRSASHHNS